MPKRGRQGRGATTSATATTTHPNTRKSTRLDLELPRESRWPSRLLAQVQCTTLKSVTGMGPIRASRFPSIATKEDLCMRGGTLTQICSGPRYPKARQSPSPSESSTRTTVKTPRAVYTTSKKKERALALALAEAGVTVFLALAFFPRSLTIDFFAYNLFFPHHSLPSKILQSVII